MVGSSPAPVPAAAAPGQVVMVDTLLSAPARAARPAKMVIILRGVPGAGKSHLAKLIKSVLFYFLIIFVHSVNIFLISPPQGSRAWVRGRRAPHHVSG